MCQLLIYNFHLLSYTLFVYRLKYLFDEFSIHATQCALRAAFLEDFVVASGLQDGHVMLFFVCTDFTCHTHPFGQLLNKIVVAFVYLLAQFAEVLGALCFLADDQQVAYLKEETRRINELLKAWFAEIGLKLIDFKLEFGFDKDGKIILADEFSPDNCRLWDADGNHMDKDVFRRGLGELTDVYEIVWEKLQALK